MLDGAFTSPKIRRLAAILGIPWLHAVGICGAIWKFTSKHAPTGEIGRHDDEEVATVVEWTGEARTLIDALVRCRLLDRVPGPARFIVHDWPDHAPRHVRATLARQGRDFSPYYSDAPTTDPTTDSTTEESTEATTVDTTSTSSSTLTSPTPSTSPTPRSASIPSGLLDQVWDCWVPGRKQGRKPGLEAIRRSIRRLIVEADCSPEQAAAWIAYNTTKARNAYQDQIANGQTELRFVPLGSTYFNQERWNDRDAPPPTREELLQARVDAEIAAARDPVDP